jgi:hypothetical protein
VRGLSAGELLDVWEGGEGASPLEQALLLLAAAEPEEPLEALTELPIGERDARLFELRARTFGLELEGMTSCSACGERLELPLSVADLLESAATANAPHQVTFGELDLSFRLPTSADLAAATATDPRHARAVLLERCVTPAGGDAHTMDTLPPGAVAALAEAMARADPLADLQLSLTCPACGHPFLAPFDIVGYFWTEIDAWARRTLREVHALASAYGWGEREILALSPARRRSYLEIVSG